jgi:hypothetical protein
MTERVGVAKLTRPEVLKLWGVPLVGVAVFFCIGDVFILNEIFVQDKICNLVQVDLSVLSVSKSKAVPQHTHGGARGERRYSSYSRPRH